jgi:simple sugar transport system permease protein
VSVRQSSDLDTRHPSPAYKDTNPAGRPGSREAAVIFGNWMPWPTMWAALLFGVRAGAALPHPGAGIANKQNVIVALPYLLTLVAVTGLFRQSTPPSGLGRHASAD